MLSAISISKKCGKLILFSIQLLLASMLSSCVSWFSIGGPQREEVNTLSVIDAAHQMEVLAKLSSGVRFCYTKNTTCHMGNTWPQFGVLKAFHIGNDGKHISITVTGLDEQGKDTGASHTCNYVVSSDDFTLYDSGHYTPLVFDSDGHYAGSTIYAILNYDANGSIYGCDLDLISIGWVSRQNAQAFVNAFAKLYEAPRDAYLQALKQQNADFDLLALRYRSASPKPQLSEQVQMYATQANDAVSRNDARAAIDLYQKALAASPWWPTGHYNLAVLLGDQQDYDDAIDEMKKYLELVPDAPDASKAQQQIWIWQGRGSTDQ